ncbi:alpha/beta hydrolase [Evansella cellulosilytica]|uniref:Alpha/beta hydrolase fold protein n=1 Tax=Evansella cellulosilytica (strain ATCC 21833 / DSM 2522 / FERM P-1141 / JCM 9156 / N-4) TaxID=649639 RepID=E6TSL0_EVAC2|nr:alpha/beta hydrolase [Evansella cellulosilytica]ADU29518.1 alpha/beta hydrolase fold protein [Evansella cellulosilytica DSM 2522]
MNMIKTANSAIHYEYIKSSKQGAETLLLVHGLGLDMTTWDESITYLHDSFNVLRFDIREHGKSYALNEKPFSWDLLVDDLDFLLVKLGIEELHCGGHSGGGNFCLELAKRRKYVNSLILISTPIFVPKEMGNQEVENRVSRNMSDKIEDIILPIAKNICYPSTDSKVERLIKIYKQIRPDAYLDFFTLISRAVFSYSPEELEKITVPKLILVGEYDVLYPPELHMMSKHYMINHRFFIIPNSSNAIMIDQPKEFTKNTIDFIHNLSNDLPPVRYTYTDKLQTALYSILDSKFSNSKSSYVQLHVLDSFKLSIQGIEIVGKWNQRKAKQIIAYIIYHKRVTREELYDVFWPDCDIIKAQNYLRVSINHIKSMIEQGTESSFDNFFTIDRHSISLNTDVNMDLLELEKVISNIEKEADDKVKLQMALTTFEYLPIVLCKEFYEDWVIYIRNSIEERISKICQSLLVNPISKDPSSTKTLLKILIKYNPISKKYYEQLLPILLDTESYKDYEYYKNKLLNLK